MDTSTVLFFLSFMAGSLLIFTFRKIRRKKERVPEVDERVFYLFKIYGLRVLLSSAVLGVILLAGFTLSGHQSISVDYIWVYLLLTLFALSFASVLAKKKNESTQGAKITFHAV